MCHISHERLVKVTNGKITEKVESETISSQNDSSGAMGDSVHLSGSVSRLLFGYPCSSRNSGKMES